MHADPGYKACAQPSRILLTSCHLILWHFFLHDIWQCASESPASQTKRLHGHEVHPRQGHLLPAIRGLQLNPIDPGVVLPFSCPHLPAPALSYLHLHLLSVALSCPQGHVFKFLGDLAISQLGAAPNTSQVPQNQDQFFPPSLGMRRKQSRLAIVCNRGLKRSAKGTAATSCRFGHEVPGSNI